MKFKLKETFAQSNRTNILNTFQALITDSFMKSHHIVKLFSSVCQDEIQKKN